MAGQSVRWVAAALVSVCAGAPVLGHAQVVQEESLPEASADTAEPATAEPAYSYALPAADAWTLRSSVSVGTPVAIAAPTMPDGLDGQVGQTPPSPEDAAILDKALSLDPAGFAAGAKTRSVRLPVLGNAKSLDVSRSMGADGLSAVSIKKPLPTDWDAKVGADLNLAANAPVSYSLDNPLGRTRKDSGAAWASVSVPQIATLDARVDPNNDQSRIGTAFERPIPLGESFSVNFRSYYSVTETLAQPQPVPNESAAVRIWGKEHVARFNILPTGTTLGAGVTSVKGDPVMHNTLSAEQKIYGPLNVTTAMTDVGQTSASKSVSAGFKVSW